MKRLLTLSGWLAAVLATTAANIAPVAQKSVSELLGIRPGTEFSGAPAVTSPVGRRSVAPLSAEAGVTINASVVYPSNAQGMWSYNTSTWNPTRLSVDPMIIATGGGFEANGKYYLTRYQTAMGFEEIRTLSYLTSDWSEYDNYVAPSIDYVATTMAYTPVRDEVYGCFINPERTGYNFVRWNYDRYAPAKTICPLDRPWSGCAFSSDGTLYAIEKNGDLYKVNIKTGEMTLVGKTGISTIYVADATIDPATDTMYWCVSTDSEYALYSINIATAAATKVYDLPNEEQLCGMYVVTPVETPSNDAPAKISSVSASFSGTALTGSIAFYSPNYTVGQTRLDAETNLSYSVKANGIEIATGECLPNKRVSVPVTMDEVDNYYFTVTTSNEAGTSPVAGTHKFVGPDEPKAPTTFQTTLSGNTANLSWSSPSSTGVNGGNVNYSAATYTVVRYPDMKVVAENISERKATDELPSPEVRTDYYYVLSTTVEGLAAPDIKSAAIALGPIVPPFTAEFTSATSVAGWTIIDANADSNLWKFYSYGKTLQLYGSKGSDDWAITPVVKVKAGTSYPVSVDLNTSTYYEETIEVMWGTEPTAEAMVNTIIAPTAIKSSANVTLSGEIVAEQAGNIYIGVHGCTKEKSNTINLVKLTIETGQTAAAPAAPGDFTVNTPVNGDREAHISFTAPSTTLGGDPLEGENSCSKIEILRDGNVIATITEGIAPGQKVEYTDKSDDLTLGNHVYGAVAYNVYGDGAMVEAEVLVGARKPVAPEEAKFIEDGNTGKVTILWDAVTTDVEGNTINSDAVTYQVIDRQYNVIADNLTGTSFEYQAVPEGEQAFCQFAVYAVTAGGKSDKMAATAYKPVGAAYETPWSESFTDRSVSSIFGYNYIQGQEPWQFVSSTDWGIVAQDQDNGYAYFECYSVLTALVSGKINLDGLNNPAFSYYTYNYASSSSSTYTNALEIQVDNGDGNGFVTVQSDIVSQTGPINQWNKVMVDLSEYDGQTVILRIVPTNPGLAFYTLDNLRVSSNVEYNLTATRISAPAAVDINKPFEVTVTVTNTGEQPVSNYTVELYNKEELVDFVEGTRLEPTESKNFVIETSADITAGEYAEYYAVIVCSDDQIEKDNTSDVVSVGIISAVVPVAMDLEAVTRGSDVELSWIEPDLTAAAPEAYTEDFESADSWSNIVEGWNNYDQDNTPVGGIQTEGFPCTGLQAWFVADHSWFNEDVATPWMAHSGQKFLASEYVVRGGSNVQSDDWIVTPRIFEGAQSISFYAKSFQAQYPESFEVLASKGTTSVDDFEVIGEESYIGAAWKQYRYKLPEGTRYAAIRSRSINKFFLFVDDVTFIPADGEPAALALKGYNIYRNNVKVNSTPVSEPTFTDHGIAQNREHNYFVTAVYDKGESRPSNTVSVRMSGIDNIMSQNMAISVVKGGIIVKGLTEGVITVCAADGRVVASEAARASLRINLVPGMYVVSAGNTVAKVIVK